MCIYGWFKLQWVLVYPNPKDTKYSINRMTFTQLFIFIQIKRIIQITSITGNLKL